MNLVIRSLVDVPINILICVWDHCDLTVHSFEATSGSSCPIWEYSVNDSLVFSSSENICFSTVKKTFSWDKQKAKEKLLDDQKENNAIYILNVPPCVLP